MKFQQQPVLAVLFALTPLLQVADATFNGIPIKPGKIKFRNNAAEYDSVSMLPGLLSSPGQRLTLDLRQEGTCPPGFPIPCPGTYCCTPSFNKCCGDGNCCPGNANCRAGGKCCPQSAQTCGGRFCCEQGATCCGSPARGCCDRGTVCCPDNTCCDAGDLCCGDGCCPSGTQCCSDGTCCPDGAQCAGNGQCRRMITSTSTSTSTSQSSSTIVRTLSSAATRTVTSTSTSTRTSSTSMPTITFVYVPGLTDGICANICRGMRARGKVNTDVLTYDPSNKPTKRAQAGCVPGRCNFPSTGRTCDEYPFASSAEGGTGASTACVPAAQNTDQGTYMRFWFADHGYLPGTGVGKQFGVEVVGLDCGTVITVASRATITGSGTNGESINSVYDISPFLPVMSIATVLPGSTFDNQTTGPSSGRLLLPLGDVNAGSYSMSLSMPGQGSSIDSLMVLDNEGEQFTQINGSISDSQTLNFDLQDDGIGVGMVLFTSQGSLDVSWNYSATTNDAMSVLKLSQLEMVSVLISVSFVVCSVV